VSRHRNIVLFFTLALLWGASFVAIEVGLDYYPPCCTPPIGSIWRR